MLRGNLNLNISYVICDLYNLDNTIFKIGMCCLVSLDLSLLSPNVKRKFELKYQLCYM